MGVQISPRVSIYYNIIYIGMVSEYFFLVIYFLISLFLGFFIYLISYSGIEQYIDIEKISIYECGFNPFKNTREPINIKYYIISILFIIFDIEILYLFPWVFSFIYLNIFGFLIMFIFLLILILIYIYEWLVGIFNF